MSSAWAEKTSVTKPSVDITKAVGFEMPAQSFTYTERDLIVYALGVGIGNELATSPACLRYAYENHEDFAALPTFGVVPPFFAIAEVVNVPGLSFNPMHLLHGETELVLHKPLPTAGTLVNKAKVRAIYDKKSGTSSILLWCFYSHSSFHLAMSSPSHILD
jgi:hypothetical protein